ncbi:MAG: hypothetical protein ABIO68_00045 [Sphingomicrobium sp.]
MHHVARIALTICSVSIAAGLAAPAQAQQMNADVFYQRAIKLKNKGPLALFQRKEIRTLVAEVQVAGDIVKARRLAAEKGGGHGAYCPPSAKRDMSSDEFIDRIGAIPSPERKRMTMVEAVTRMLAGKFPCRG